MTQALRLEEAENNGRVIEVLHGVGASEEFVLRHLRGDAVKAATVYAGVAKPLMADDVADVVSYAVKAPHLVELDEMVVRPVAQAAAHKVIRRS